MKIINLLSATILSIGLTSGAQARESFYKLHNSEPSISVNLGALGNLEPAAPTYNGRPVSGYIGAPGTNMVTAQPVIDPQPAKAAKPAHKTKQLAKIKPTPKPAQEETAEVETAPTPTLPPLTEAFKPIAKNKPAPSLPQSQPAIAAAPAKPSINLPEMAASDIKNKPAPTPIIVAAADNKQPALSDMPAPAIIPEATKTTPNLPAKDIIALRKADKIVTLPASAASATSMPELSPPPAPQSSQALPKLIEEKSAPEAKKPTKTADNIGTLVQDIDLANEDAQTPTPPPAPKAKPEAKKPAPAKAATPIAEKSLDIPPKPVSTASAKTPLIIQPHDIIAAPVATLASKPALPPIAASSTDNPLEKPTVKELPPLSDLFDKKETTSGAVPAKTPLTDTASMPTKESVIVQSQNTLQTSEVPAATSGAALSMVYGEAEVELPLTEKPKLDGIISQLAADKNMHIAVIAYASGTPDQASQAKRTALARALAVRSYLLDHNINADRMDIKPLGNKAGSGVPDRVDIVLEKTTSS